MQIFLSSSKETSILVADRYKNVNKQLLLLMLNKYPKISLANVVACWLRGLTLSLT